MPLYKISKKITKILPAHVADTFFNFQQKIFIDLNDRINRYYEKNFND